MAQLAIAMDLGTSGFRAQAIDSITSEILSTVITTRHPLPGANVIDHLHFSLEMGIDSAQSMIIHAVNRIIRDLPIQIDTVQCLCVCGNPIQLSIFQGMEIRDLSYAGKKKLDLLGITIPERGAAILPADHFPGLALPRGCNVIIPPAISHEVGADALALIMKSGMMNRNETSIAIDYGTNAEMALCHNKCIITGSTAAGPALEGQHISCGVLAIPGAISDLKPRLPYYQTIVLNQEMLPEKGAFIDMSRSGYDISPEGYRPVGITGTGTIAAIQQGIQAGLVIPPEIHTADHQLHLGEGLYLSQTDLVEAGKAIGAIRAGYITLCNEAKIALEEIVTVYMSGAAGTYVDARKAQALGLLPPCAGKIYQIGNTSLAMARDIAADIKKLDEMTVLAKRLRENYCLFASSEAFRNTYILELSHWTEGMPLSLYRSFLQRYRLPDLPPFTGTPEVIRLVKRDIDYPGRLGLITLHDIGMVKTAVFNGCTACFTCTSTCPQKAISLQTTTCPPKLTLDPSLCLGIACRRCERACPEQVFLLQRFFQNVTQTIYKNPES
ncbi:MAG: methylamine methyltransferase corrinoid protein reductive activase [Methanospirillaceae archaeon]|nr:methylamine methyltransferase corrinoid protein reductive activase [Methanospirillaceae archaeon]